MSGLQLGTFQIGSPALNNDGLRIAVTRRPPRGIPKADWKRVGCFDVWLPVVAPSTELLERFQPQHVKDPGIWNKFLAAYEKELLGSADTRQTVVLIATLAARMPVSIGCFCADESHCHRSRLYELIVRSAE